MLEPVVYVSSHLLKDTWAAPESKAFGWGTRGALWRLRSYFAVTSLNHETVSALS